MLQILLVIGFQSHHMTRSLVNTSPDYGKSSLSNFEPNLEVIIFKHLLLGIRVSCLKTSGLLLSSCLSKFLLEVLQKLTLFHLVFLYQLHKVGMSPMIVTFWYTQKRLRASGALKASLLSR